MDLEVLKTRLIETIEPLIKDNSLELVALDVLAGGQLIRLLVDKTGGGIILDEIAVISRQVSALLDTVDLLADGYALEVSSPGINRPLRKKEDFTRFAGKKVKVVTIEKIGEERVFIGRLKGINGEVVSLLQNEKEVLIDFNNIRKANVEEDFF